jgi:hypothetical protein
MCCTCGRFLSYQDFTLEHIIPQQALADDPVEIKSDPKSSTDARSGVILLCNKRLILKNGRMIYKNGCNSWKGRFYDSCLREILNGNILKHPYRKPSDRHMIAILCSGYLAMVLEFGYQVVLMASGLLMRQQFFLPFKFHRNLPLRSQMILAAPPPEYDETNSRIWSHPFSFTIDRGACYVGLRTSAFILPLSRDPRIPISKTVLITPSRYKLRPDFRTVFE